MKSSNLVRLAGSLMFGAWIGCSAILGVSPADEDICTWIDKEDNCYREFHKNTGFRCGYSDLPQAKGSFDSRVLLDVCHVNGGQVIFDPPLNVVNLTHAHPIVAPLTVTFVENDGTTCGMASLSDDSSFFIKILLAQPELPSEPSQAPEETFSSIKQAGAFSARGNFDVICSDGTAHLFNADRLVICPQFEHIFPMAIFEADPGRWKKDGFARLKIMYPPTVGQQGGTGQDAIVPEAVYYFDCSIPGTGAYCSDGKVDVDESDVDCGRSCELCILGKHCNDHIDCGSGNCVGGSCTVANCTNSVKDGAESDVDCGGPGCPPCVIDKTCTDASDCVSDGCVDNKCSTCGNNRQDPPETDVDCGGNTCGKCVDGQVCYNNDDCLSGSCFMNTCIGCDNGKQDGQETDVDCGGPACARPCKDGQKCFINDDCAYQVCFTAADGTKTCNTCNTGQKDGVETDVDCGGGFCPKCEYTQTCIVVEDCQSDKCVNNTCIASCPDGTKNGTETDIDCGGTCPKCGHKQGCFSNSDCLDNTCLNGLCYPATCANVAIDPPETALNCGGGICPACSDGLSCKKPSDCQSSGCLNFMCTSCANGVKDDEETDVDCGGISSGSSCATCATGKSCSIASDCTSGSCTMSHCD